MDAALDLPPDVLEAEILIDTGELVVRILDAAGEPMGQRTIEFTQPHTSFRTTAKTDAEARAFLGHLGVPFRGRTTQS